MEIEAARQHNIYYTDSLILLFIHNSTCECGSIALLNIYRSDGMGKVPNMMTMLRRKQQQQCTLWIPADKIVCRLFLLCAILIPIFWNISVTNAYAPANSAHCFFFFNRCTQLYELCHCIQPKWLYDIFFLYPTDYYLLCNNHLCIRRVRTWVADKEIGAKKKKQWRERNKRVHELWMYSAIFFSLIDSFIQCDYNSLIVLIF